MNVIQAGPFTIYAYGTVLALGTVLGFLLMKRICAKRLLNPETVEWFFLLAIPAGVIGARILYFLVSLPWFIDRGIGTFFLFSDGGYMLYGAMAGICLAAGLTGRITRQPAARILDCAAAPFALVTAAARGAEYFAGIGLGEYVEEWFDPFFERTMLQLEDSSFFQQFPFAVPDADGYWRFPVFLAEAAAALVFLLILLRINTRRDGTRALIFLALYAGLQAFLESLRIDLELRWGFVKVNQLLTLPVMTLITVICAVRTPKGKRSFSDFALSAGAILGCCGVIMAMEFALEQKIGFLRWMRMDLCWTVMMTAGVLMAVSACRMILRTDRLSAENTESRR